MNEADNNLVTTMSISLTVEEKQRLDKYCNDNMIYRSKLICKLFNDFLDSKDKKAN